MPDRPNLKLYVRSNCHLCHEAWDELAALAAELDFDIEAVDADGDPLLAARFQHLVPVVDVAGGALVFSPITTDKVLDAIALRQPGAGGPKAGSR